MLTAIHCFNEGIDGFSRFDGALPHGLSLDDTNVQVVERLGEPHNKGGTNVPVWIEYQDKGVQVNFKGLSFDDRSNPIASLTLFAPDPSASATGPAADAERLADTSLRPCSRKQACRAWPPPMSYALPLYWNATAR